MHAFNKQRSLVQTIFSFLVCSLFLKKRCIIIKPTFSRFLELSLSRHTHSGGGCHEFHTNHEECEVTQLIFASPFKRLSISSQLRAYPHFKPQNTAFTLERTELWPRTLQTPAWKMPLFNLFMGRLLPPHSDPVLWGGGGSLHRKLSRAVPNR